MQPRPFVVIQGLVTGIALCALALLGVVGGAAAGAVAVAIAGLSLSHIYRAAVRQGTRTPTTERLDGDSLVTTTWVSVTLAVALVAASSYIGVDFGEPPTVVVAVVGGMSIASAGVLISSMVDWYWVLPRVTGLLRPAPWESPGDHAWSRVTRVWLWHRALASLAVSGGIVFVPLATAVQVSGPMQTAAYAVAGVLVGAVLPLNGRLVFALNPPVRVGDVLHVPGGAAYVLDVSLDGARVRIFGEDGWPEPWHAAEGDRIISLSDLRRYPLLANPSPLPADAVRTNAWRTEPLGPKQTPMLVAPHHALRDELDDLLEEEAVTRHKERAKRDFLVSAEVSGVLVGSIASLAAAAAALATSGVRTTVVAVVAAALGALTAGLVGAAEVLRRRDVAEGETAVIASLAPELEELGSTIGAQRHVIRKGLRGRDALPLRAWSSD